MTKTHCNTNLARAAVGLDESALQPVANGIYLHNEVIPAYRDLLQAASQQGFALQIVSGYRSFAKQLTLFNAKANGLRPILDDAGEVIAYNRLNDVDKLWAILRYSALPGASRHHWGTDIDVIDRAAMTPEYQLRLTPDECCGEGVFAQLHRWLDDYLPSCDFYRPYSVDRGGIAPEPWHLSHAPTAERFAQQLTLEALRETLLNVDIALKPTVLANLPTIFQRYVRI